MTHYVLVNMIVDFFLLNVIIFSLAFFFAIFYTTNFIRLLIHIEIMLLTSNLNFIAGSILIDDIIGQVFVLFVLSIVAAESAIGLAIFILYYRVYKTISIYSLKTEQVTLILKMSYNKKVKRSINTRRKSKEFVVHPDGFLHFYLYLTQTYNNFFLTLTDDNGCVIQSASGGFSKLRGTKRRTYTSAEIVASKFIEVFKEKFDNFSPTIKVRFVFRMKPNIILNTILNIFIDYMNFDMFLEVVKVPHNGMRKRKVRRI